MKLVSISFKGIPRMPGVRAADLSTIVVDKPGDALKGWKLSLRGTQAFFISPPGWVADRSDKQRNEKGPVTIFEVPRAEIAFQWSGSADEVDAICKGGKYDSEPFGWMPTPIEPEKSILAQIPRGQVGDA